MARGGAQGLPLGMLQSQAAGRDLLLGMGISHRGVRSGTLGLGHKGGGVGRNTETTRAPVLGWHLHDSEISSRAQCPACPPVKIKTFTDPITTGVAVGTFQPGKKRSSPVPRKLKAKH